MLPTVVAEHHSNSNRLGKITSRIFAQGFKECNSKSPKVELQSNSRACVTLLFDLLPTDDVKRFAFLSQTLGDAFNTAFPAGEGETAIGDALVGAAKLEMTKEEVSFCLVDSAHCPRYPS